MSYTPAVGQGWCDSGSTLSTPQDRTSESMSILRITQLPAFLLNPRHGIIHTARTLAHSWPLLEWINQLLPRQDLGVLLWTFSSALQAAWWNLHQPWLPQPYTALQDCAPRHCMLTRPLFYFPRHATRAPGMEL